MKKLINVGLAGLVLSLGLGLSAHAAESKGDAKHAAKGGSKVEAKGDGVEKPAKSEDEAQGESRSSEGEDNFGGYGKPRGLLGPVTLGAQVTLVGLPSPFRVGIEGKWANILGFGVEYGFIPSLAFGSVSVSLNTIQGTVKVYPGRGAFFAGLAVGNQAFTAKASDLASGVTVTGTANTFFLTPMIGWKWVWESGFFMGLDLGWQFALSSSASTTVTPSGGSSATDLKNVNDALQSLGQISLPSLTLLQFGYLF